MDFATGLRTMRTARGWSQIEVAKRAGLNQRYVSDLEVGNVLPGAEWEARLREALDWGPEQDAALDKLNGAAK